MEELTLRFTKNDHGCNVAASGGHLCPRPSYYYVDTGNVFCVEHGKGLEGAVLADERRRRAQPTCDRVLPVVMCEEVAWTYATGFEAGEELHFLCERHAQQFKQIRPTFEQPWPKGYEGKRIK